MKLSELIRKRGVATATVATPATVAPVMRPSVATVASVAVANTETELADVATDKPIKPLSLQDRQREARRQKVIAMLEAAPGTRYAVHVADASTDPVVVAVGIREIATFEMEIPHQCYDGMALLELIEKQSGEKYANN